MSVRIRSLLASGPIMVPLNSGRSVRLSPGRWSAELRDTEVADNAYLDKLHRRGDIEVAESREAPEAPEAPDAREEGAGASRAQRPRKRTDSAG
ncbi:hypothetical protein [Streptomyces sp. NPDC048282]|uniref:hypothetical protein n=1 Tax=Streptomyces sp. NPDC048282 TaxID=3365528 RepID=UPI003711CC83